MLYSTPSRPAVRGGKSLCVLALLGCLLLLPLFSRSVAHAATVRTVNTFADTVNSNDGFLSLREAISFSAAGDVINFSPAMSSSSLAGTMILSGGELAIGRALTIQGPGARKLILSGNTQNRIFNISGTGAVIITGLTLTRGRAPLTAESQHYYGSAYGGAIYNTAPLTLVDCAVTNSWGQGGSGPSKIGGGAGGGGIYNLGSLTMRNCQLSGNYVVSGNGGTNSAYSYGGAIHSHAPFTLINTTLSNNSAQFNSGAIQAGYSQQCFLIGCTISRNYVERTTAVGDSGGVHCHYSGRVTLRNTLIAQNYVGSQPQDVGGTFVSQGYNLVGANDNAYSPNYGTPVWLSTDLTGTNAAPLNANLGPLRNNSGPTDTMALLPGSPALNIGDNSLPVAPTNITTDQRGLPRRMSTRVDIGAYEVDVALIGSNLVVNSLNDPGDGIPGSGECTLREALSVTNLQADANTLTFKSGLTGVIVLSRTSGPLSITSPVTLTGPGARLLTVSGGNNIGVFTIGSSATVTLFGMTIRDGFKQGAQGTSGAHVMGGGIQNAGNLTLFVCSILNNRAWGGAGAANYNGAATGGNGFGGGIYNTGRLTMRNCTLAGNEARGGDAFTGLPETSGNGFGGGIYNFGAASLTNCTFNGNGAYAGFYGFGGRGNGAAIHNAGSATLGAATSTISLLNCTVVSNRAYDLYGGTGGGLFMQTRAPKTSFWNFIRVRNSIVAQNIANTGPDAAGTAASDGNNLIGKVDGSDGWTALDRTGTVASPFAPQVSTMANNGGPTDTMRLLAGSPAINNANTSAAPPTDQRGAARSGAADIGAFEFGVTVP